MVNKWVSTDESSTFENKISPFYKDIQRYCYNMTSTQWEGEDLLQETLIKIYLAIKKQPDKSLSKRYFYLIAKNTWIDQNRRKRVESTDIDTLVISAGDSYHRTDVRESLEQLADYLSIKQFVIVLLMDVFLFTAKETANFINETESNVHTTLHRARRKLTYYAQIPSSERQPAKVAKLEKQPTIKPKVFEDFLEAFRKRNPKAIYEGYLYLAAHQISLDRIQKSGYTLSFHFKDPDGNVITVSS
ncbi:hypothetical protein GCM10008967_30650 [Bacillus carboniphilus]|uniref:RNA polymerase n=1 Tax=Bacillus carboniphilus TaxID=86663 RepID=A0ABN0WHU0_9BACI